MLICFEGIDGAGKSQLVDQFMQYLNDRKVKCGSFHFPHLGSHYGNIIYQKLNGKRNIPNDIFQGLYVLDFYSNQEFLENLLEVKDVVILDRYFYSTLAYSNYYGNIYDIENSIYQLRKPDLIFYLKVPAEIAIDRLQKIDKKDEHESNIELLIKTLEGYDLISNWYNFNILDGIASIEENLQKVINIYNNYWRINNG